MFLEALDKLLADHATGAAIRRLEAAEPGDGLWQAIAQAGFLDLMRSEEQGGAALRLPELFPLLECLGRYGVPLPIAQTIVARGWLPDLPDDGMVTIATQCRRTDTGSLRCLHVPGAMVASHVLVCDADRVLLFACADAQRESVGDRRSLTAHLDWVDVTAAATNETGGLALRAYAAALTSALLSGAMQRTFEMTLTQCNGRIQFGKSIGKFQAIQQQISVMAEHVLAASIAAESAFRHDGPAPAPLAAAVAKSRTSEAAGLVAATAHAVHGAIGMTDEFDLAIVTRRLHEWRMQYGAETFWNQQLGAEVLAGDLTLANFVRSIR
jgi:acyl-CoA dehydrogenase